MVGIIELNSFVIRRCRLRMRKSKIYLGSWERRINLGIRIKRVLHVLTPYTKRQEGVKRQEGGEEGGRRVVMKVGGKQGFKKHPKPPSMGVCIGPTMDLSYTLCWCSL